LDVPECGCALFYTNTYCAALIHAHSVAHRGESGVPGDPWHLAGKHRVRSGQQRIAVTVPREPIRAGIDPNHLLIDLETGDTIEEVKIES
jgi:hypothetical protein